MKHFVGSKGGAGVPQWLISLMPPHRVYVEAFLGRGVILKSKLPAELNIGIDCDAGVIADFERRRPQSIFRPGESDLTVVHGCAISSLQAFKVAPDWLVYADPPYLVRKCNRRYYRHDMVTPAVHDRLLSVLTSLQANVMISGYWSELYANRLASWRYSSFWTVNRRGQRVQEFVWMNFPEPARLHDCRFVGSNYTRRQGIKRKAERWRRKFLAMTAAERQYVLNSLLTVRAEVATTVKADYQDRTAENGSGRRAPQLDLAAQSDLAVLDEMAVADLK